MIIYQFELKKIDMTVDWTVKEINHFELEIDIIGLCRRPERVTPLQPLHGPHYMCSVPS
jgi:hypothetical protein